jgi:hypothetical protein
MTCVATSKSATFKRGSTFAATCTYTPPAGGPANLNSVTLSSDIIDSQSSKYDCTITKTGALTFTVSFADTSTWSLGQAKWDIRFVNAGVVYFSETMRLNIIEQVTT